MATSDEIHVGDIGTQFIMNLSDKGVVVDVSGATVRTIYLRKKGEATKSYTATNTTDGTDGDIEFLSVASTFNKSGDWEAQAYVNLPAGEWRSAIVAFHVYANL